MYFKHSSSRTNINNVGQEKNIGYLKKNAECRKFENISAVKHAIKSLVSDPTSLLLSNPQLFHVEKRCSSGPELPPGMENDIQVYGMSNIKDAKNGKQESINIPNDEIHGNSNTTTNSSPNIDRMCTPKNNSNHDILFKFFLSSITNMRHMPDNFQKKAQKVYRRHLPTALAEFQRDKQISQRKNIRNAKLRYILRKGNDDCQQIWSFLDDNFSCSLKFLASKVDFIHNIWKKSAGAFSMLKRIKQLKDEEILDDRNENYEKDDICDMKDNNNNNNNNNNNEIVRNNTKNIHAFEDNKENSKNISKKRIKKTELDDGFFALEDMNAFVLEAEENYKMNNLQQPGSLKKFGRGNNEKNEVDSQNNTDEEDDDQDEMNRQECIKNPANMKYTDFFDPLSDDEQAYASVASDNTDYKSVESDYEADPDNKMVLKQKDMLLDLRKCGKSQLSPEEEDLEAKLIMFEKKVGKFGNKEVNNSTQSILNRNDTLIEGKYNRKLDIDTDEDEMKSCRATDTDEDDEISVSSQNLEENNPNKGNKEDSSEEDKYSLSLLKKEEEELLEILNEENIEKIEESLLNKSWEMSGEVKASQRPKNSLLDIDLQVDTRNKTFRHRDNLNKININEYQADAEVENCNQRLKFDTFDEDNHCNEKLVIGERNEKSSNNVFANNIELVIKNRIETLLFDDVPNRTHEIVDAMKSNKGHEIVSDKFTNENQDSEILDFERSRQGLAELYAERYQAEILGPRNGSKDADVGQEKLEMIKLFAKIMFKLDNLSNQNFIPLRSYNSLKKTIQMEEITPIVISSQQNCKDIQSLRKTRANLQEIERNEEMNSEQKTRKRRTKKAKRKSRTRGLLREGRLTVKSAQERQQHLLQKNLNEKRQNKLYRQTGLRNAYDIKKADPLRKKRINTTQLLINSQNNLH